MIEPLRLLPDRGAYVRAHASMAAVAMGGAMALLWVLGNPHVWTGAVAGLAAIALRGWYLASEELGAVWLIQNGKLLGPGERRVPLADIAQVRIILGNVQVVTRGGDKHLIKYLADPEATRAQIDRARGLT
ncbi:MAG: hypothetical protein EP307_02600 [Rhodobacteraceae bacterium]|nr:MAG: hypothetical protein EP307_02600 [Paracoccaceae bacterium]